MIKRTPKLLKTKQEILNYLDFKADVFDYWVERGMPATVIRRRWYAWAENLDEFFKSKLRAGIGKIPEEEAE